MFGTEAAFADNRSYNSSPSHSFLTSVDDTLRADNLSPSSSQGSSSDNEIQPPSPSGSENQLTELQPLKKLTCNISTSEIPVESRDYSSFSSINSDSSSPTYYNSLITPMSQIPANLGGVHTPTATSSTHCSTMTTPTLVNSAYSHALGSTNPNYNNASTTPTSASPSHYSSLNWMTTPTSASPSYYSSLDGITTPTSAGPSYYSSLDGTTTPCTDYLQYAKLPSVNHPSLTPPVSIASPLMPKSIILPPQYSLGTDSSPLSQYKTNVDLSPLSHHRVIADSSTFSDYKHNGASQVSTHRQHPASRKYDIEYQQNNTSPRSGMYAFRYFIYYLLCHIYLF